MRPLLIGSIAAASLAVLALAAPQRAHACSPIDDRAEAPDTELPYEASKSPAAPVVVEARIVHDDDPDIGCAGGGSCGPFNGLSLTLGIDSRTSLIRIDFADRPHIYAHVWNASGGDAYIFIPGYSDDEVLDLTVRAIDDQGYTSQAVSRRAFSDDHGDDGCSASGSQSSALLVLFAGLLVAMRRRGRSESCGPC